MAGNAANASASNVGDFIYTSNLVLNPVASVPVPALSGLLNGASLTSGALSANSWVTLFGTNLSTGTRAWSSGDFPSGVIPFTLTESA